MKNPLYIVDEVNGQPVVIVDNLPKSRPLAIMPLGGWRKSSRPQGHNNLWASDEQEDYYDNISSLL